jgi:Family of unknown function (DUF5681)
MAFPSKEHQWKPGFCPNPGGRPKGRSITSRLRDLLDKSEIDGKPIKDGKQVADLVVDIIIRKAIDGDYRFVDLVMNRIEGKIPDTLKLDTDDSTAKIREFLLGKTGPPEETG